MPMTTDGWVEYRGGTLAKCPGTKTVDNRRVPCHRWFMDVGQAQLVRVRVHPHSGAVREPKPTRPNVNVTQCHRCEAHLEVEVLSTAQVA
jgi:hypothetical protein